MTTTYLNSWRDVPADAWRWANFPSAEIACRGTGLIRIHPAALDKIQALRSGFMHYDLGPARRWGEPFPPRPVPVAVEAPPARERLADSRTMKGGGAVGVATIDAGGAELADDILAETQDA